MSPRWRSVVVGTVATVAIASIVWVTLSTRTHRETAGVTYRSRAITTIAGATCSPGHAQDIAIQPFGIAIDPRGGYFVTDVAHAVVCHIDAAGNAVTVAGNGAMGYIGDGGAATASELYFPTAVAVTTDGSLYIADRSNQRIRYVDGVTQRITTVAGNGRAGDSGDGGRGVAAELNFPSGLALRDSSLYVADSQNHRVRRLDLSTGIIDTVAGTGVEGYDGDGGLATAAKLSFPTNVAIGTDGALLIADTHNDVIRRVQDGRITTIIGTARPGYSGDGGAGSAATLRSPTAIAAAGEELLVADGGNNRVRRVDASGVISTVAGVGDAGYAGDGGAGKTAELALPAGLAVSATGDVLIADSENGRVRALSPEGAIRTIAGNGTKGHSGDGGPAAAAELNEPIAVATTSTGEVLVAESLSNVVRRIGRDGVITTIAGVADRQGAEGDGGPATAAHLTFPTGVAASPDGSVYIADQGNHRIRQVRPDGTITTIAGTGTAGFSGDGGPAVDAQLGAPSSVLIVSGDIYVADSANNRIRRIDPTGVIETIAGNGSAGFSGDGGAATDAQLAAPTGMAASSDGVLYIADTDNNRIRALDVASGTIRTISGTGEPGMSPNGTKAIDAALNHPTAVAVDRHGDLYIADKGNCVVREIAASGPAVREIVTVAGWPAAGGVSPVCGFSGEGTDPQSEGTMLYNPTGLAIAPGDDAVIVADSLTNRVRRFWRP